MTNTFTVGNVAITLDEADVNEYGQKVKADGSVAGPTDTLADRVDKNEYKLIPGHEYVKDPIIHFQPESEASYLFVKLENGIKNIVADTTIENQILAKGWALLSGTDNIYYKSVAANESKTDVEDYSVFDSFKLTSDAKVADYNGKTIKVTAYAVQADGFTTAAEAWAAAPATWD